MPEIRELSVTCDKLKHVSAFTVTMLRGQYPIFSVIGQGDDIASVAGQGKAVDIDKSLEVHGAIASQLQQEILEGGASDNFTLTISGGGEDDSVTFKGILSSAEVVVGKLGNGVEIQAFGTDAVLDYFDLSPYKIVREEVHRENDRGAPGSFKEVVQRVVGDYHESVEEENQALHEANMPAWNRFLEIIDNSEIGDDLEQGLSSGSYPSWRSMYTFVAQVIYASGETGLFAALNALAESLACVYIPEPDKAGKLMSYTKLVREAEEATFPGTEQITSSFSRRTRIPMQHVSIEGATLNVHRSFTTDRAAKSIVASYSEDGGLQGMSIPVPAWHCRELQLPHIGLGSARHDIDEVREQLEEEEEQAETVEEQAVKVLTALAKSHFDHLQKAAFTITLQDCPLTPNIFPGYKMVVPSVGEGPIHTVKHMLTLDQDEASVSTAVIITHATFGS